jgi:hypothetical protein
VNLVTCSGAVSSVSAYTVSLSEFFLLALMFVWRGELISVPQLRDVRPSDALPGSQVPMQSPNNVVQGKLYSHLVARQWTSSNPSVQYHRQSGLRIESVRKQELNKCVVTPWRPHRHEGSNVPVGAQAARQSPQTNKLSNRR